MDELLCLVVMVEDVVGVVEDVVTNMLLMTDIFKCEA